MGDEDGYKDFGGAGVSAFEQATGPFLYNAAQRSARFKVERRHCNQLGLCHGGALLTFADFSLFVIGSDYTRTPEHPDRPAYLTTSLHTHFLSVAQLVIRGLLTGASGKKILAFDGTIKRLAGASLPAKL